MKINYIAKIGGGQDGAIYGKYLFRFQHNGNARVYDLGTLDKENGILECVGDFVLDRAADICPHSNSVSFGNEFYEEGDEFPLLYSNIYNNYAKSDNSLKGVCCVYRIFRDGDGFSSKLVQLIEVGFVNDATLWKMSEDEESKRPYGNFAVDAERSLYYGFVMREAAEGTRYFAFRLPKGRDGELDSTFGVRRVTLFEKDIIEYFDVEHHKFVQGACIHGTKVYSLEGFTDSKENPPAIRIVDTVLKKQEVYINLVELGYTVEPELVDFYNGACYYADVRGNLYTVDFE